jgi:hypothetical protein
MVFSCDQAYCHCLIGQLNTPNALIAPPELNSCTRLEEASSMQWETEAYRLVGCDVKLDAVYRKVHTYIPTRLACPASGAT